MNNKTVIEFGFRREIRPNFSGSHTFSPMATTKIGPDTSSLTSVLTAARFWLQC